MAARREQGVWVNSSDERATIIVNADGTAVSAGGGGGTSSVDDAPFTVGVSSLTPSGGIVTADSVDAGDVGAFAMLANRQQMITLYDSSGVEITSFGGGTQYTEDAAAAANPVGGAIIVVRDDARGGSLTTTDGDNVALRGTNAGELYVKHVDAVTVNSHAVTNAGTFAVQAAQSGTWNVTDVSGTVSLPTGAATAAKQPALGTAGTASTDVITIQGIASGTVVPISVASIPSHAVTNAGTFATQVDGAALTALQLIDDAVYAEDVASQAADKGISVLAVRRDADTSLVGTDGDYANLQVNAAGSLKVAITAGAGSGGTSLADNAGFTPGTTSFTPIGGEVDDTGTAVADENSGAAVRITPQRAFHVNLRDVSGAEVSVGGGTQYDEDAASAGAEKLTLAGTVRRDTAASSSGTDGDYSTLNVNATGRLWTSAIVDTALPAGANAIGKLAANSGVDIGDVDVTSVPADPFGANADAASATGSISAKLRFIAGTGIPITGTVTVGSHAVTVASGGIASGAIASGAVASGAIASGAFASGALASGSIAAGAIADMIVDDAAFTPATSRVLMAGFEADETATDSVDEGDGGAARMTLDRKIIMTLQPHTAGGLTTFMASGSDGSSILVATAQAIKASAGQLYGYYMFNPEAAVTFVHFYNTAQASVTVGTTNPLFTVAVPAGSAANLAVPQGITFSNAGWSCAATTTAGGNTAPATGVSLVAWYM